MDALEILRIVFALLAVLGLIGLVAVAARKTGLNTLGGGARGNRRLEVIEILPVDARRRAVILRHDDREHLILLGQNTETLIASSARAQEAAEEAPAPSLAEALLAMKQRAANPFGGKREPDAA